MVTFSHWLALHAFKPIPVNSNASLHYFPDFFVVNIGDMIQVRHSFEYRFVSKSNMPSHEAFLIVIRLGFIEWVN